MEWGMKPTPIFDLFGTLVEPQSWEHRPALALAEFLQADVEQTVAIIRRYQAQVEVGSIGRYDWLERICGHLHHRYGHTTADAMLAVMGRAQFDSHWFPSAHQELLQLCRSQGDTGVLSTVSYIGRWAASAWQLDDGRRVSVGVYSCDVHHRKPDPEIYRLTADLLRAEVHDCHFFDDTLECVAGAMAAGMPATLLLPRLGSTSRVMIDSGDTSKWAELTHDPLNVVELGELVSYRECKVDLPPTTLITVAADLVSAVNAVMA
jgi:FMN phosphatase YigB (HAD superfamily)